MATHTGRQASTSALTVEQVGAALRMAVEAAGGDGAGWLLVDMLVPYRSVYEFTGQYGEPRSVHLPVLVSITPQAHMPVGEDARSVDEHCRVVLEFVEGIAVEAETGRPATAELLYMRAVLWGQQEYGSADAPGDSRVPPDIEGLVLRAFHEG